MSGDGPWPTYEPKQGAPESGEAAPPPITHQPPAQGRPGRPPRPARLVVWLGVAVVGGVLAAGYLAIAEGDVVSGLGAPDALSAEGLGQLRDDVEERTGATEVFRAVIYPEYASVDLPVDATSQREESMRWDGDLEELDLKGTSSEGRVDLIDVDATVVTRGVEAARSLVEDPTTWYVIIDGPSPTAVSEDRASITAYATNEFGETAFVEYSLGGQEIRRYVSTED